MSSKHGDTHRSSVTDALTYMKQSRGAAAESATFSLRPVHQLRKGAASALYALIIGIDVYKHRNVPNLHGSVADANDMQKYLTETLHVPSDRIETLRNEQATRKEIKSRILSLGANKNVAYGDPILIFYAGHGSQAERPVRWASSDKIQLLLPYDFVPNTNSDENAQGIPDITLSALLSSVADMKDNNITVIFDSCHSASGTRQENNVRGVYLSEDYRVMQTIDQELLNDRYRGMCVAKGYENAGIFSHILLAACKSTQRAREQNGRGAFTQALLALLRNVGTETITYNELIDRLPALPFNQDPQCEGRNRSRVLFDTKAPNPGRVLYPVEKKGEKYVLQAGEAHGVAHGAMFDVYKDMNLDSQRLGSLVVDKSLSFTAILQPTGDSSSMMLSSGSAWASLTHVGKPAEISIAIPLDENYLGIFRDVMYNAERGGRRVQVVGEQANPDLVLGIVEGQVHFNVMDATCKKYGFGQACGTALLDPTSIYNVISSAANLFWELNRSGTSNDGQARLSHCVSFRCFKLVEEDIKGYTPDPIYTPEGNDLNQGNTITFNVRENDTTKYGYEIVNESDRALYAWLFYFDMSDFSISCTYAPGNAKERRVEHPLPPHGSLTIGYGSGGHSPVTNFLRPGQDLDIGFLKLFLSTEYVDLSDASQPSPFESTKNVGRGARFRGEQAQKPVWDIVRVTIVQQKANEKS